ncbi:MAG: tetratricopeptide repeat protein [Bacteroidota bacterium]
MHRKNRISKILWFRGISVLLFAGAVTLVFAARPTVDTSYVRQLNEISWQLHDSAPDSALALAKEALRLSREWQFPGGIEEAQSRMGSVYLNGGNYQKAMDCFVRAVQIRSQGEDLCYLAQGLQNIAACYRGMGQLEDALESYLKILAIRKRNCAPRTVARSLISIGNFYAESEDYVRALVYHKQSYRMLQQAGAPKRLPNVLRNIANDYQMLDLLDSAASVYAQAIAQAEHFAQPGVAADCYLNVGVMRLDAEEFHLAERYFSRALRMYRELGWTGGEADIYLNLGILHRRQKRWERAASSYRRAIKLYRQNKMKEAELEALNEIAGLEQASGRSYHQAGDFLRAISLSDSLHSQTKAKRLATLQAQFQDQEKTDSLKMVRQEKELEQAKAATFAAENQSLSRQRTIFFLAALGLLAVAFLIWLLLRTRLQTTRARAAQRESETRERIAHLIREGEARVFHALFEGKEQERRRIATDLHDNLGSMLSTVKLYFSALEGRLADLPADRRDHLSTATRLMDDAVGEVRRIAHDLVNGTLVKVGLVAALEEMAATIAQTGQTDVEVLSHGLHARLESETEIALFRIVQELLNNTLRHADAQQVTIQLNRLNGILSLMVEDDGRGFNPEKVPKEGGMGLNSIRERVAGLGGKVTFDSQPRCGTTVVVEIPLAGRAA